MKECIDNILHEIDIEINNSYFSERDIITNSLKMTQLEKPLYFDPFGQIGFTTLGRDMIDPLKSW